MDGWTVDTRCRDLRCVRVFIQVQTVGGQPSRHSASLCVVMLILLDVFVVAGCRSCRSLLGPGSVHLSAVHTIYIYIYIYEYIPRIPFHNKPLPCLAEPKNRQAGASQTCTIHNTTRFDCV